MAFDSFKLAINLKYRIPPKIFETKKNPKETYAIVSKSKIKPSCVGIIALNKYCPRKIDGISVNINKTNKIFVDVFIPLFCNNKQFVFKDLNNFIKALHTRYTKPKKGVSMEKQEQITKYLNAIYQNTKTALQSIEDILPKTDNEDLKSELAREQDAYFVISKECELFAKSESIENIKDNNFIEKAKLWTSINMSTMMNSTTRHIAELMLMGTFMGVITCIKDEFDHQNVSKELDEIIAKLKKLEEENLKKLIPFLK